MDTEKLDITEDLLLSYLHGTLSEPERKAVDEWYEKAPENAALLDNLFEAYSLERALLVREAANADAAYNKQREQMQIRRRSSFSRNRGRYIKLLKRFSVAAAVVLAIVYVSVRSVEFVNRVEKPLNVPTDIGERVRIELPDGSHVSLNACSEIAYGPRMFSSERSVAIKGEAYFEVQKMEGAPFVVHCEQMDIRVLGTKFNVQANSDDECITTTLLEGAVQVTSPMIKNKVIMRPDQQLVFNRKTGTAQLTMTDQARASRLWTDGRIHFYKATFAEIAKSLERNYNITISFRDDQIRQKQFICDFDSSDNIHRILSILQLTGKFEYRIQGRQVEIWSL